MLITVHLVAFWVANRRAWRLDLHGFITSTGGICPTGVSEPRKNYPKFLGTAQVPRRLFPWPWRRGGSFIKMLQPRWLLLDHCLWTPFMVRIFAVCKEVSNILLLRNRMRFTLGRSTRMKISSERSLENEVWYVSSKVASVLEENDTRE